MNYRGYVLTRGWNTGVRVLFLGEFVAWYPSEGAAIADIDDWLDAP